MPDAPPAGTSLHAWKSISRGKLIAILVVLLVGLAALYFIEPRVETHAGAPPDPSRAILTPFLVTNGGFLPFHEVQVQCVVQSAEFGETAKGLPAGVDNSVLHVTSAIAPSLRPGQQVAVTCSRGMENAAGTLQHADFDLNVCLKPYPLIDYLSMVHFRYVGDRGRDGRMQWVEQAPRHSSKSWIVSDKKPDTAECKWAE